MHNPLDVRRAVVIAAERVWNSTEPEVGCDRAHVRSYNDIVSLPNTNAQDVGRIWNDRDEVS